MTSVDGSTANVAGSSLDRETSEAIFGRDGSVALIEVAVPRADVAPLDADQEPVVVSITADGSTFIGDTEVTDAGMKYVARLGQLHELDLRGTRLSDQGLRQLAGLGRLERIALGRTRLSSPPP